MGGIGGTKWVPPHLRGGTSAAVDRGRLGVKSGSSKLDPLDDEAFPDLGLAAVPKQKAPKMPKPVKKKPVVKEVVQEKKEKVPPAAPVESESSEQKVKPAPEVQPTATVPVVKPAIKK